MDRLETAAGPTAAGHLGPDGRDADAPLSTLRGARIEVNGRWLGRAFLAGSAITLIVLSIAFFVIGAHKNAQISELRNHGTPVQVTALTCRGLMGGSGSNAAGYACTGTFTLRGHRFSEAIPGSTLYAPGTKIPAVAADNDSGLFTLPGILAGEHASWRVYLVPSALAVALILLLGVVAYRRRSRPGPAAASD